MTLHGAKKYKETWDKRWGSCGAACLTAAVLLLGVLCALNGLGTPNPREAGREEGPTLLAAETDTLSLEKVLLHSGGEPDSDHVLEVTAVNVLDEEADVILVYPYAFQSTDVNAGLVSLEMCFPDETAQLGQYQVYRIEQRQGRYQVIQKGGEADTATAVETEGYLLLVKKTSGAAALFDSVTADWPTPQSDTTLDGSGDSVYLDFSPSGGGTLTQTLPYSSGTAHAYVTVFPKAYSSPDGTGGSAGEKQGDRPVVTDPSIRFQLFDYDGGINYTDSQREDLRPIAPYFAFRGNNLSENGAAYTEGKQTYDADAFPLNHATVERKLVDGYPVLDINRAADGGNKGTVTKNADGTTTRTDFPTVTMEQAERSLAYLFGGVQDHAVSGYTPKNTLLQKVGNRYTYASSQNAVDYDMETDLFRVRSYRERNSVTASYGTYWDFLPFNYTDGVTVGTRMDSSGSVGGQTYNVHTDQTRYWFGMRMEVDFYQPCDGMLESEEMTFRFAGDDDVWVFLDDVLVLDLGGTHGEVTGSINFATGEITQTLTWRGASEPSYPTTLKACFEAAGAEPNGGWKGDIFADYTGHTLSFFYLERGASVANCKIDFNLYTLPKENLTVAKTLESADGTAHSETLAYLKDTMDYRFQVLKADGSLLAPEGTGYVLKEPGKADTEKTVSSGGYFTLRSGQSAVFSDTMGLFAPDEAKQYVVREYLPADHVGTGGQYRDVCYTMGGTEGTAQREEGSAEGFVGFTSPTLSAAEGNLIAFRNQVNTSVMGTLCVAKTVAGAAPLEPETYYFKIFAGQQEDDLTALPAGTPYTLGTEAKTAGGETGGAGLFTLNADETLTLRLLAGTYFRVEEVQGDGSALPVSDGRFAATYAPSNTGQFTASGQTVTVTAVNTYDSGAFQLTKTVNNTSNAEDTDGEFVFQLALAAVPEGWTGRSFPVTRTGEKIHESGAIVFNGEGKAALPLYHGETAKIVDLPMGTRFSVTELTAAGYTVSWQQDGASAASDTVAVKIDKTAPQVELLCVNTTGYELPATGGGGVGSIYAGGALLTLASLCLCWENGRRKPRERRS